MSKPKKLSEQLSDHIKVNPDYWGIRCKICGDVFTMGEMIRKHKDRQKDAPTGMYYVKCPVCGKEDFLTIPEIFMASRGLFRKGRVH